MPMHTTYTIKFDIVILDDFPLCSWQKKRVGTNFRQSECCERRLEQLYALCLTASFIMTTVTATHHMRNAAVVYSFISVSYAKLL